jgi:hypothetical protein
MEGDQFKSLISRGGLIVEYSTTGGSGGYTITVSTLAALSSAVAGTSKKIVIVAGEYIPVL